MTKVLDFITVTNPWDPVLVVVKSLKNPCVDPAELIAEKEVVVGLLDGAVGFRADTFLADELSLRSDDVADTGEKLAAELSKEFDIEVDCKMPVPDTMLDIIVDVSEMFELVIVVGTGSWLGPIELVEGSLLGPLGADTKIELIEALGEMPEVDEFCQSAVCVDIEGSPELFLSVGMVWNEDGADGKLTLVPVASLLMPLCELLPSALYCFELDTLDLSLSSHVVDLVTMTVFAAFAPRLTRPICVTLPSSLNFSPSVRRCAPRPK
jgi:hypothetical protein